MSATGSKPAHVPTLGIAYALPQLVAHRGNTAEFPENTLPALRSALELGIKHVEFDVHLTADHVPVVANSHSLARTANLDCSIFSLSAEQLAHIRVNEPDRFGQRFSDVGIPTLAQAAELLATIPAATAFVDIQPASLQQYGYDFVIHCVCECLHAVRDQVVLITSDLPAVEFIRRRKSFRTGWILTEYSRLSALKCEAIAPEYLFCDQSLLANDKSRLWRGPWHWVIGDVTSHAMAMQLVARGAEFILTAEARRLHRELRHVRNRS